MTPTNIWEEIYQLESNIAGEHEDFLDVEIMVEVSNWIPNPGNTSGRRNQYMHSVMLYW